MLSVYVRQDVMAWLVPVSQCVVEEQFFELPPTDRQPSPSVEEYDFVERPTHDFFCPVSLELLLEPQLTSCCGNHLSLDVSDRLRRDGKACPMCSAEGWGAVLDKYHRRRVQQVRVRCWHRDRGCTWEGEVKEVKRHSDSCTRRPWVCKYCQLKCELGEGGEKHWPECHKFPEPCPNGCEVGSVERCGMEQHRSVCPLEPVACEMEEFGCSVVVPRKKLATHMRESELQHLTAMTALNLRLTRQLQQDSVKRDRKIEQLQQQIADQKVEITKLHGIDRKISELTGKVQREVVAKIAGQQGMLETIQWKTNAVSATMHEQNDDISELKEQASSTPQLLAGSLEAIQEAIGGATSSSGTATFIFGNYNLFKGSDKSQYSVPFYSHFEGYKLRLKIKYYSDPDNDIGAFLCLLMGEHDGQLHWPVTIRVRLEVINQAEDYRHVGKVATCTWSELEREEQTIEDPVMKYATLERELENVQFMMDDCLEFKITVTVL